MYIDIAYDLITSDQLHYLRNNVFKKLFVKSKEIIERQYA